LYWEDCSIETGIVLYSRDHTGVGVAYHRITPKISLNSPI